MKPDDFELVETLDRDALARHPVWAPFRSGDRPRILGWGVAPERLDAELARYEYCGLEPLFPVLDCERLPERPDLIVAARFRPASGPDLEGYLLAPLAFGVFADGREFVFNRSLSAFSLRSAEGLAGALGMGPRDLFPLWYRSPVRGPDGAALKGEISSFW